MGRAAAVDLASDPGAPLRLLLVDRDLKRVKELEALLQRRRHRFETHDSDRRIEIKIHVGDAMEAIVKHDLDDATVVAAAVSWDDALPVTRFAAENGLRYVGIGRTPDDPKKLLDGSARKSGAVLVMGAGLEPGLTEVLTQDVVVGFDAGASIRVYCGGIPLKPRGPLKHLLWYGGRLSISARPTYLVDESRLLQVRRFSDVERLYVPGVGSLEAYHDGMLPWFAAQLLTNGVVAINQKTLRWPGFASAIKLFEEIGLLNEKPIDIKGTSLAPRDVLDAVIAKHVSPSEGDEDLTILVVVATGSVDGSAKTQSTAVVASSFGTLTGMGRLTGAVLAESVRILGRASAEPVGLVSGVHHPHEFISGLAVSRLLDRLSATGVSVVRQDGSWINQSPESAFA